MPITPTLEFAGGLEGSEVSPALADFVGDGAFLTRWNNNLIGLGIGVPVFALIRRGSGSPS